MAVRLPSGRLEVFDLRLAPAVSPLVPFNFTIASLEPRAGTRGTLELLGNPNLIVLGSQPGEVLLVEDVGACDVRPRPLSLHRRSRNRVCSFERDRLERVTERNGIELVVDLDGVHHSSGRMVQFARDDLGRIISLTEPNGNVQEYVYSANGDLVKHVNGAGEESVMRYNLRHQLLRILGPDGEQFFDNEYDDEGRLTSQTRGDGSTTTHSYDLDGKRHTVTDPEGGTTVLEYDDFGNMVSTTNALGETWLVEHNALGYLDKQIDPLGHEINYVRDDRGNQTQVTTPTGDTYLSGYDGSNQIVSLEDPLGRMTTFDYDSRGNLTRIDRSDGTSEAYAYDEAGNRIGKTDGLGNTTVYEYDEFGQLVGAVFPGGHGFTQTLDENGNLLRQERSRTLADGTVQMIVHNRVYDGANREVSRSDPEGYGTTILGFDKGQVSELETSFGEFNSMEYDADGQLGKFVSEMVARC